MRAPIHRLGEPTFVARIPCKQIVAAALLVSLAVGGCASTPHTPSPSENAVAPLTLVAVGDSIPNNSSEDCPNCTGFVDRYATALGEASRRPVKTMNLSEHTGLALPDLITELPQLEPQLSTADAIIVGIAHNSFVLNADSICGATFDEKTNKLSDWTKIDAHCAAESAAKYEKQYDQLYARIAALRDGKPTILLTINRYSDWIGWNDAHLTLDQQHRTTLLLDAWNTMICTAAETHAFTCADIYHAFNGPQGHEPAGTLLAADYTHPSDEGNAAIAKVLIQAGFEPVA